MQYYSSTAIDNLITRYIDRGGIINTLREGILGHGTIVLSCEGYKTIVVNEIYINEWSSGHTIRKYNKPPKKYTDL